MNTTTAPSPFQGIIWKVQQECATWQAQQLIDGETVAKVQALVLLSGLASGYSRHADYQCLDHEIQEAMVAFLAKDFPGFAHHVTHAQKWKEAMDAEIAEARRERKTPVR